MSKPLISHSHIRRLLTICPIAPIFEPHFPFITDFKCGHDILTAMEISWWQQMYVDLFWHVTNEHTFMTVCPWARTYHDNMCIHVYTYIQIRKTVAFVLSSVLQSWWLTQLSIKTFRFLRFITSFSMTMLALFSNSLDIWSRHSCNTITLMPEWLIRTYHDIWEKKMITA